MIRRILLAATVAASFASFATTAAAQIVVRVAPPSPRVEVVPEARRGHVWVPGYWGWKNRNHQWVKGHWIRERQGYHYSQPAWMERDGRWHMQRGAWRRGDRDGDGVPNRQDRAPDNSNRS